MQVAREANAQTIDRRVLLAGPGRLLGRVSPYRLRASGTARATERLSAYVLGSRDVLRDSGRISLNLGAGSSGPHASPWSRAQEVRAEPPRA